VLEVCDIYGASGFDDEHHGHAVGSQKDTSAALGQRLLVGNGFGLDMDMDMDMDMELARVSSIWFSMCLLLVWAFDGRGCKLGDCSVAGLQVADCGLRMERRRPTNCMHD
jgi:hypothetical protein